MEGPEIGNFGIFSEWKVLELGSSRTVKVLSALKGNLSGKVIEITKETLEEFFVDQPFWSHLIICKK